MDVCFIVWPGLNRAGCARASTLRRPIGPTSVFLAAIPPSPPPLVVSPHAGHPGQDRGRAAGGGRSEGQAASGAGPDRRHKP